MKKLLTVVIVGVFMLGSGLALAEGMQCQCQCPCAQDGKMGQKECRMEQKQGDWQTKRLDRMAKELNLTPEQKDKLNTIFKEDAAKIKAVMDKVKKEMATIRESSDKNVKSILTPEQAKKMDEMKAERQKRMGEGKGMGRMKMKGKGMRGECPLSEEMPMMEKK